MDKELNVYEFLQSSLMTDNEQLLNALASRVSLRRVAKGTRLFQEGEQLEDFYLLYSGILRAFYQAANGMEITEWLLSRPGMIIFPNYSLDKGFIADTSTETLTDSELLHIPLAELLEIVRACPELPQIRFRLLVAALDSQNKLKRNLTHRLPAERYAWLVENRPELVESVPQKYIASFLGMTPVSLSRIRSRYKEKPAEE
ncbi:MAG: Crp/Fnr family transcriptional regulator [Oscillospiraceae bacterium]|nr:Crp/Fnr family transcriptional regulator [Oscillospiraceae bacterium]